VASGRDLLLAQRGVASSQALIFADPDFDAEPTGDQPGGSASLAMRAAKVKILAEISFGRLPGTAREGTALDELVRRHDLKPRLFKERDATRVHLEAAASPRILHLATHGDLLPDAGAAFANPMRRGVLALAGANRTIAAWIRGQAPPADADGVFTAEQAGGLQLRDTWLVTLSACDTGIGEVSDGEGVLGLRRGFVQAGAQNLLMTLWPISDHTTVELMLDFYERALTTGNAAQALAETQRDWLVRLREERGALAAIRLAGPFIMTSQGQAK
jgi:CHAT domain-containing protein